MNKYRNPDNTEEIIQNLKECKNFFEVKDIITDTFPGLLVNQAEKYSDDYKFLEENWEKLCKMMNVEKQSIIIVDFNPNPKQEEFSLLVKFYDIMTRNGFIVRGENEMILCSVCKKALLSKDLYMILKHKGNVPLPSYWSKTCISCK